MLTDLAAKSAKAKDKGYKLNDAQGLHLYVSPASGKAWRYRFKLKGKEQLLTIGSYPEVSLAQAREKRAEAHRSLREGRDPRHAFQRSKLLGKLDEDQTFEKLARSWFDLQRERWKTVHANDVITSLERDIFPAIGTMPIDEIDEPLLLAVLRKVEKRGAIETSKRLKQRISAIFLHCRGLGLKTDNPAANIGAALKPVPPAKRLPALVTIPDIRKMVSIIDDAGASPITRLASRMLALTSQRPGMVRNMQWSELTGIDWSNAAQGTGEALWTIPSDKMKQELHLRSDDAFEHLVPLSTQSVETLRAVRWLTGRAPYVFPNSLSGIKPMSTNAIGYLYNREGYKGRHVPHGWRSSFSTIMNEVAERELGVDMRLLADRFVIDLMLAHSSKGLTASELRYNRAAYLPRRRELAQLWADKIMEGAALPHDMLETPRRRLRI